MKVNSNLLVVGLVLGGLVLASEADAGGCWGKITVTVCCKPLCAAPVVRAAPAASHCCGYSTPGCWNAPSMPFIPVACSTCAAPAPAPTCCGVVSVASPVTVIPTIVAEPLPVHPSPPVTVVPPMPTDVKPTRIMLPLGQEGPK